MSVGAEGSISRSSSQRDDRLALPEDVQGLRGSLFDFLENIIGGQSPQGLDALTSLLGQSAGTLQQMLNDPNFAKSRFSQATEAISPIADQIIREILIPQISERNVVQGLGTGTGSSAFGQQLGLGTSNLVAQLLPQAVQTSLAPFGAAQDFRSQILAEILQGAQIGSQAPVLTSGTSESRAKSFGGHFGLAGG
jgi:hypothetical protein